MLKTYQLKVTKDEFPKKFIVTMNGSVKLTDSEIEVLGELLKKYLEFIDKGYKGVELYDLLFQTKSRKEIAEKLNLSSANFNNIFNALKKKEVILQDGESYLLSPYVIPTNQVIFEFIIV